MKFKAEIDDYRGLKKGGMKLPLYLSDSEAKKVLQHLSNFLDRQLVITVEIDTKTEIEKAQRISPEMRKKVYAILRDMGDHIGQDTESMKVEMKREFLRKTGHDDFSLSGCEKDIATKFIDFLVRYCFEYGIPLKENPKEAYGEEVEQYIRLCLEKKKCCVCGRPFQTPHHVDTIGMGSNRKKVDDSNKRKLPICNIHHKEAHTIGDKVFCEKYHIVPVK
jgi:hypothetical protein